MIAEKWKDAIEDQQQIINGQQAISPKHFIENLQFQTRDNSWIASPQPDVSEVSLSGNFWQGLFDEILP